MYLPSIFSENFFDDWMDYNFPTVNVDKQLYGKNANRVMKTDVREHEDGYEVEIDLPGFKKDEIDVQLEQGYLTIKAAKAVEKDQTKRGKIIRQERYSGTMSRTFYVGDSLTEEDIKGKFEDGVLKLSIPKAQAKIPEKKTIAIEG
ncbi:MAG: Hsp20/alpha crystallin family protein [Clostridia bacterium]|nr:Hsp20/alpha crystallin family protein [Clostridia bacterium]